MEIEAKYRATEPIDPSRIEALDLTPYVLGPQVEHDLRDSILDTPALDLVRKRFALRVRQDGDNLLLTLKEPGTVVGGTHRRQEWEEPLATGQQATPAAWPASIRERVQAITGAALLQEIVQVRNHRRTWEVWHEDQLVGELALDHGTIRAGEREIPMHEIGFEVKAESGEAHLAAVVQHLTSTLPLEAESRSKLERGLALLER